MGKMKLKSELMSVRTSSNFDYIAMVCLKCGVIGMLGKVHNEYFCSKDCQRQFNELRFGGKENGKNTINGYC